MDSASCSLLLPNLVLNSNMAIFIEQYYDHQLKLLGDQSVKHIRQHTDFIKEVLLQTIFFNELVITYSDNNSTIIYKQIKKGKTIYITQF